ncbi:LbetaH domain-containing protein [Nocardioides salsibiostraticola]
MLAPNVAIVGGDHVWTVVGTPIQFTGRAEQSPTLLGRDVWVGRGVILRRGVSVGDGAVIGAGAVVTGDVPEYEVWVGNPARRLRARFSPAERLRHRERLDSGNIAPNFATPLDSAND